MANNSIGNRWLVVLGAILIQLALGAEIVCLVAALLALGLRAPKRTI